MIIGVSDGFARLHVQHNRGQFPVTVPETPQERMKSLLKHGFLSKELRVHDGQLQLSTQRTRIPIWINL